MTKDAFISELKTIISNIAVNSTTGEIISQKDTNSVSVKVNSTVVQQCRILYKSKLGLK